MKNLIRTASTLSAFVLLSACGTEGDTASNADSSAFITRDAAAALLSNTDDAATSISIRTIRGEERAVVRGVPLKRPYMTAKAPVFKV